MADGQPSGGRKTPSVPPSGGSAGGFTFRTYVAIAVTILALILILQNSQEVAVDFIFATTTLPLVFALLIAFALGGLVGWLLPRFRRKREAK